MQARDSETFTESLEETKVEESSESLAQDQYFGMQSQDSPVKDL